MSAHTEALLQQISEQEEAIRFAAESGHDTASMRLELKLLKERLVKASQALNENKQLLKS